jgi:GT2 family glycosyltransferase
VEVEDTSAHRKIVTEKMQLSVIIVNYNVRAFLENAIVSVCKASGGLQAEVIVVDNASDDGSVEMMRQKFPSVKLIVNEKNLGFATANNIALREAHGKYVLLLNPDTVVQEDTLHVMMEFLDQHPDVGLAGCKILNPDGTLQLACRRSFPTPWVAFTKIVGLSAVFPRSKTFSRYNLEYLDPDDTYEVDAVSGSFMFFRREIVEQVGTLDEQFFMYGEDLDWCYRTKKAGWKICYVHATQIIHYKGESARRSDIDEVKLFYQAMRVFVQKHFARGPFVDTVLRVGIAVREQLAFLEKIAKPVSTALLDIIIVDASLLLGEFIWFGEVFHFPQYGYPVILTIPALIVVTTMYAMGAYTKRKLSASRTASSVIIGYLIISASTFFFKQYGFSRMVVLISGVANVLVLPGWRLVAKTLFSVSGNKRKTLFGRRTLIVGVDASGQAVLQKLRARVDDGYDVVGFVDTNRRRLGEKVAGVEILGSIDNIGKVIEERRATEVIFSIDTLSYSDILSVIGRSRNKAVNFRLVPNSLEVIIGKTHIDELDDIPLVDIEYNIDRSANRLVKRLNDLVISLSVLLLIYPVVMLRKKAGGAMGKFSNAVLKMPDVSRGAMSIVGPKPEHVHHASSFIGKPGVTGIVQINYHDDLTPEEVEKYNLYYAKNQSLLLDLEIVLKSIIVFFKK